MEFLNRVEVQGVVTGTSVTAIGDTKMLRMSVMTEYCYHDAEGTPVIENTWFNVSAFEGHAVERADAIETNDWVNVKGRLKKGRYISSGQEVLIHEVYAHEVTIVKKNSKQ